MYRIFELWPPEHEQASLPGLDRPYAWLKKHHIMKKLCCRYEENPVLAIFTVGKNISFWYPISV